MLDYIYIIGGILLAWIFFIAVSAGSQDYGGSQDYSGSQRYESFEEREIREAGKLGEAYAQSVIRSLLRLDDILLCNLLIEYDDMQAELDNLVINENGIFIIEVKRYSGVLVGAEDDLEWLKIHVSQGGNEYHKYVRNPIRQVKRQTYILSSILKSFGVYEYVKPYVFFVNENSPIRSDYVLNNVTAIDKALHNRYFDRHTYLDRWTQDFIKRQLLEMDESIRVD